MENLRRRLYEAIHWRSKALQSAAPQRLPLGPLLSLGLETRTNPADYRWDGMKRGADPRHPFVVFQYTLAGMGIYEDGAGMRRLTPGHAFLTVVPSPHVYYLPRGSQAWNFFWLILDQAYVVERLAQLVRKRGAVAELAPGSPVVHRALALFEGLCFRSFADVLAVEGAMFEFMLEYERSLAGAGNGDQWLLEVRQRVMAELRSPLVVEQLAAERRMSRSHYTHAFRKATGLSPARYITEVRLQEVSRQLVQSDAPLKEIATHTGFADANHLCKCFRRVFHTSPGQFRRLRRPG
jgi:AraC-like DNA-binding protein